MTNALVCFRCPASLHARLVDIGGAMRVGSTARSVLTQWARHTAPYALLGLDPLQWALALDAMPPLVQEALEEIKGCLTETQIKGCLDLATDMPQRRPGRDLAPRAAEHAMVNYKSYQGLLALVTLLESFTSFQRYAFEQWCRIYLVSPPERQETEMQRMRGGP